MTHQVISSAKRSTRSRRKEPAAVRIRAEELSSCPLCGSSQQRTWRRGFDRLHRVSEQESVYSRCQACDLIYQSLRPLESEIGACYPSDYGPYSPSRKASGPKPSLGTRLQRHVNSACGLVLQALDACAMRRFWRRYWQYYQPLRPGKRLLDFGCGSEQFLNRARALGWETAGMDFHSGVIERVRTAGHWGHVVSPDAWEEIPDGGLDFVRLSHVLEHLYAPRETLAQLKAKMRPGATLHIAVPDPNGLAAWLFGSCWFGLECPRHIMLYTPDRLQRLLAEIGFTDATVLHEAAAKDVARSIGYGLADLGWIRPTTAPLFAQFFALQCVLYPSVLVAAILGRGDRLHIFAKA